MSSHNVQQIESRSVYPISTQGRNVSEAERLVCGGVGLLLLLAGLKKGSLRGLFVAAVGGDLVRKAVTGHSYAYQVLGLNTAEDAPPSPAGAPSDAAEVAQAVTVMLPLVETYRRWRDPETFARAMAHFAEVSTSDPDRAHWEVKTPLGKTFAWDARVVEEVPERYVRWETLPGAAVPNETTVTFREAPGGRGTEISFAVRYDPPGGLIGDKLANVFEAMPKAVIYRGMRRFKSLVETGEMPTNEVRKKEVTSR